MKKFFRENGDLAIDLLCAMLLIAVTIILFTTMKKFLW